MRNLSITLPSVYDLLPTYRCVDDGATARHLTLNDVVALGGDRDLAERSFAQRLDTDDVPLVGHRLIFGVEQPTVQSLTLANGLAIGHEVICRPASGEGTTGRRR
jgi:hypothetical protein